MRNCIVLILALSITKICVAQKTVTNQALTWFTFNQNLKINDRFSVQTDIQERFFIAPLKQSQFLIRSTFKTAIKQNWDFGVGFCFFLTNTDPTVNFHLQVPEVRPYIEFNNKQVLKRIVVSHRYRLESRFFKNSNNNELQHGFSFGSMRFRYQLGVDIILNKPKDEKHAIKLRASNEIMLNFGNKIKYNLFDQNRLSIALQYAPIKSVAFEIGYVNWFQQRASGSAYFNRNILRIGIVSNIHLNKKKNQSIQQNN